LSTTDETALPVREIMTAEVVTITADRSVDDLARELLGRGYSGFPVVDGGGAVIGMVSEYDVISKRGRTVGEIMSQGVIGVDAAAGADQVAGIMGLHGIRRVPVLRDGRLVGIVSRTDLLRLFAMVNWTCTACGHIERGFTHPTRCPQCPSSSFRLERAARKC
jgi:CBS-domain-containing membrane protein